jgi:trehalose-phosphatase
MVDDPVKRPKSHIVPVFLPDEPDLISAYQSFCDKTLWNLLHYDYSTMASDEEMGEGQADWDAYRVINQLFAEAISEIYEEGDLIWVHNYHLMLLPSMLRQRLWYAKIGFFVYTPFPSAEIFRILPYRSEILKGILGADLVGFHTYDYSKQFAASCTRLLGLEGTPTGIEVEPRGNRRCEFGIYPAGIDVHDLRSHIASKSVKARVAELRHRLGNRKVIVGIDRLDDAYAGIPLKLLAFERFLNDNPSWHGRVVLIQVSMIPKQSGRSNAANRAQINEYVARINSQFGTFAFSPVHYITAELAPVEVQALMCVGHVCIVSVVRDGMGLIPYEWTVCQHGEHKGCLILSEFAGAAASFSTALHVNPWNVDDVSVKILTALEMKEPERAMRGASAYAFVTTHTASLWGKNFVEDLEQAVGAANSASTLTAPLLVSQAVIESFLAVGSGVDKCYFPPPLHPAYSPGQSRYRLSSAIPVGNRNFSSVFSGTPAPIRLPPPSVPLVFPHQNGTQHRSAGLTFDDVGGGMGGSIGLGLERGLRRPASMGGRHGVWPGTTSRVEDCAGNGSEASLTRKRHEQSRGSGNDTSGMDGECVVVNDREFSPSPPPFPSSGPFALGSGSNSGSNCSIARRTKKLFILDYDGTLVAYQAIAELVAPSTQLLLLLAELSDDEDNYVVLLSGRPRELLSMWFGHLDLFLVAEDGSFLQAPGETEWVALFRQTPGYDYGVSHHVVDGVQVPATSAGVMSLQSSSSPGHKPALDSEDAHPLLAGRSSRHNWSMSSIGSSGVCAGGSGIGGLADGTNAMPEFKTVCKPILSHFAERTPGVVLEEGDASLSWHYTDADADFGRLQARELQKHLESFLLQHLSIEVAFEEGSSRFPTRWVRVRMAGVDKAIAVQTVLNWIREDLGDEDDIGFVLCAGDDRADEGMFADLQDDTKLAQLGLASIVSRVFTVRIGSGTTMASAMLENTARLSDLLEDICRSSKTIRTLGGRHSSAVTLAADAATALKYSGNSAGSW